MKLCTANTLPAALIVAVTARCVVPVLLRWLGSPDASADTVEELLSCAYIVLALLLFSHHAQRPKEGSVAAALVPDIMDMDFSSRHAEHLDPGPPAISALEASRDVVAQPPEPLTGPPAAGAAEASRDLAAESPQSVRQRLAHLGDWSSWTLSEPLNQNLEYCMTMVALVL